LYAQAAPLSHAFVSLSWSEQYMPYVQLQADVLCQLESNIIRKRRLLANFWRNLDLLSDVQSDWKLNYLLGPMVGSLTFLVGAGK
jgi:hypothetical protein